MKRIFISFIFICIFWGSYAQQWGYYASAVFIETNNNNAPAFYDTRTSTSSSPGDQNISGVTPAGRPYQSADLGTYAAGSGNLELRGGEVKTYKGGNDNVCSATMYYTVYLSGSRPATPVFTAVPLGFYDNCGSTGTGTFNPARGGGPCGNGDQKWQSPGGSAPPTSAIDIDLTMYNAGNYVLEVYYAITGATNNSTGCSETKYDNNSGSATNYTANFTLTGILPVKLVSFTGRQKSSITELTWQTASEQNSAYFSIEKSSDGNNFAAVGKVAAAGNTTVAQSYSFTDLAQSNGTVYYRLKMVDKDGKSTYSPVIKVQEKTGASFSVTPNPGYTDFSIKSSSLSNQIQLAVYSVGGQKLLQTRGSLNQLNIELNRKLSRQQPGIYILQLADEGAIISLRLMKK